jgi:N-acetylmuramoyl-L-alanine amidase
LKYERILLWPLFIVLWSCGIFGPRTFDWQELPEAYYAVPPFAKYLDSIRIVIDPGHGGQGHLPNYKRGRGGVREAEINLRVALYLREFLETAGAEVIMTRLDDSYVSLEERAEIANQSGAYFMISIHHNAGRDPEINQSAVFYHKNPNFSPASLDLARHIYFGLLDALHLTQISEDGLYSDQLIYPDGFGLLRHTRIPAVLLESSYFSNPDEEKRLKDRKYNKREAYGIFIGLCRYAAGGFPRTQLIQPENGFSRLKKPEIVLKVADGLRQRRGPDQKRLRIFSHSISVELDGYPIPYLFDSEQEMITCQVDSALANGMHVLTVDVQNIYKNHNLPHPHELIIASPCRYITFETPLKRFPRVNRGFIPVDICFMDQDSLPVWQGTNMQATSSDADIFIADTLLKMGTGRIFVFPLDTSGTICLTASADNYSDTLNIRRDTTGFGVIQGQILSHEDSTAITGAGIYLNDTLACNSDDYGIFTILKQSVGIYEICVKKNGYHPLYRTILIETGAILSDTLYLSAVYDGIFHHQHLIIDPRFHETFIDRDEACFRLAHLLQDSLSGAGCSCYIPGRPDDTLSVEDRITKVNAIKKGWYLGLARLISSNDQLLLKTYIYPGNMEGAFIADSIGAVFRQNGFLYEMIPTTRIAEIRNTNKTAVGLSIMAGKRVSDARLADYIFTALRVYYREIAEMEPRRFPPSRE